MSLISVVCYVARTYEVSLQKFWNARCDCITKQIMYISAEKNVRARNIIDRE